MHSTSELQAEKLPCKVNPTLVAWEDHRAGTEVNASQVLGESPEIRKPNWHQTSPN